MKIHQRLALSVALATGLITGCNVAGNTSPSTPSPKSDVLCQGNASAKLNSDDIRIVDGDTIKIIKGSLSGRRIRLRSIDAPETNKLADNGNISQYGQRYGKEATDALRALTSKGPLYLYDSGQTSYGRMVATLCAEKDGAQQDLNRALLDQGMAWLLNKFNTHKDSVAYREHAQAARNNKVGLWGNDNENRCHPAAFRHDSCSTDTINP